MAGKVEKMRCTILRVLFQRDTFSICVCRTKFPIPEKAARSMSTWGEEPESKEFSALGDVLSTELGKEVLLTGSWEQNKKYGGLQLRVSQCEDYTGQGREEVVAYLSSNALNGIGRHTAEAIYDRFGEDSASIIANDPRQLLQITGIKEKKLEKLIKSYEKNHALHTLTQLLAPHNVSFKSIIRISKTLGPTAAQLVRQNPYILSQVRGFGFVKTDEIALSMGVSRLSEFRVAGAFRYVLEEAQDSEGHLFLPRGELVSRCCSNNVLNKSVPRQGESVTPDLANKVLDFVLAEKESGLIALALPNEQVEKASQRIYTDETYFYETHAAKNIVRLLSASHPSGKPYDEFVGLVKETQANLGATLDEIQEQAVIMALTEQICIITGGPGTGKTTTLNILVQAKERTLTADSPGIFLAAPTARAARRMKEQTQRDASTLHSLLGLRADDKFPTPAGDVAPPLEADMLIVDESSMIDAHLLAALTSRLQTGTQLVFVGDVDQLPSVGAGNVLKQLLMTPNIKHVKLEKIYRQGEDSVIPVNSKRINTGRKDLRYTPHFKLIACENETDGAQRIVQLMERAKVRGMLDGIQILTPMRRRGDACVNSLNELLHDVVNPPAPDKPEMMLGTTCFRVGDKVMHTTRNTEEASNGDIGYITNITPMTDEDRDSCSMTVRYAPDWDVTYSYTDALDYLELATATTIHKSQGSEFDVVLIPLFKSMSFFLQRNVLYTAVTRARVQVAIVGQEEAIARAISKVDSRNRNTLLAALIIESMQSASRAPSLL